MKTNYTAELDEITRRAQLAILMVMEKHLHVELFRSTGKDDFEEDWSLDIYDDVPDFPSYDTHDSIEYAAIKELKYENDNVFITGILKKESYPDTAIVTLRELDAHSSCALANYLAGMELPTKNK
ncbi:MAG: hypothetical protein ABI581_00180 [Sediminibacterium sp.]